MVVVVVFSAEVLYVFERGVGQGMTSTSRFSPPHEEKGIEKEKGWYVFVLLLMEGMFWNCNCNCKKEEELKGSERLRWSLLRWVWEQWKRDLSSFSCLN